MTLIESAHFSFAAQSLEGMEIEVDKLLNWAL